MVLAGPAASAQAANVSGDFNGDGRSDLAVSVEGQTVGGQAFAGAVQVIYGSKHGLSGNGDRVFSQDTPGVKETAEPSDEFGNSLASGDFNGDGRADLALGTPFEDRGTKSNTGVVQILYGSKHGLRVKGNQLLVEGQHGLKGSVAPFDNFGYSLAATNLGRGRQDDLAIGAAYAPVSGQAGAGAAQVVYGSRRGLNTKHNQRFTQGSPNVKDAVEADDHFGWSLAAADFGRNGHADLAIGVRGEDLGAAIDAGAVNVLYGSRKGVRGKGSQFFTQDTLQSQAAAETGDSFGYSLAASDYGRSRRADLAIGVRGQMVGGSHGAGEVNVLYGSRRGLVATGSQSFTQDNAGVADTAGVNEEFGSSLAAANLGHNGRADLAIGAPNDCPGSALCTLLAGAVNVLYGSHHGLTTSGAQYFSQDTPGVADSEESGDNFGWALATGSFRGTKVADLAIGAPTEDLVNPNDNAGAVNVLRGSSSGITTSGDQFLTQGNGGLEGMPGANEFFGSGLSGRSSGPVFD